MNNKNISIGKNYFKEFIKDNNLEVGNMLLVSYTEWFVNNSDIKKGDFQLIYIVGEKALIDTKGYETKSSLIATLGLLQGDLGFMKLKEASTSDLILDFIKENNNEII